MDTFTKSLFQIAIAVVVAGLVWFYFKPRERPLLRSVAILVLGDIGRSPRMMYHAESFATNGFETYLIGYRGAKPVPSLLSLPHVHFLYLSNPPAYLSDIPFILAAPCKIFHQVMSIMDTLLYHIPHPPEFILVQNPPSIPTLALVWLVARLRGSKVIIDWHNLGYSILALKLGERHILVKVAKAFEAYFGRSAYAHLFVTRAMRDFLVKEWHLQGHKVVLHDRPPARFHRASPTETHELFLRLRPSLAVPTLTSFLPPSNPPYSTPFTSLASPSVSSSEPSRPCHDTTGSLSLDPEPILSDVDTDPLAMDAAPMATLRSDRPALVVSSTSWTPDEDFGILIDALVMYEKRARILSQEHEGSVGSTENNRCALPKLLVIVTGKGPLRDTYMQRIGQLQDGAEDESPWQFVRCVTMWLEAEDYPILLGSADLGVSLHSSSSALDLPMKVVDMFGCELPVCALGFACLDELVLDGVNGLVFHNDQQLAGQLESLFSLHPNSPSLELLRASLMHSAPLPPSDHVPSTFKEGQVGGNDGETWQWSTWAQNWNRMVRPLVLRDVGGDEL
ncbi:glycosyltransferase family 33 protein [Laetiporus sulphureus 93-53]|uniref:Chitobiosyldiphosphodolichol beta-mannosyltransferase n=1 Tax=Laetiporus sulphureus 93-53 TaxID=1314785 RepID=A0A165FFC8_9APHY|nr:glycosyltransferase family 33 protein [Laetiporus sulphureus 93-53]KZT08885.1 glycosyltransferase family 33 protein [Laetiporus sulphureus 93-53]